MHSIFNYNEYSVWDRIIFHSSNAVNFPRIVESIHIISFFMIRNEMLLALINFSIKCVELHFYRFDEEHLNVFVI